MRSIAILIAACVAWTTLSTEWAWGQGEKTVKEKETKTESKQPQPEPEWPQDLAVLDRLVDLDVGEGKSVELANGHKVTVKLVALKEHRDSVRDAVRRAEVTVEVDGKRTTLVSSNYNLPVTLGQVQIDCPITQGPMSNGANVYGLKKDARLRLWPKDSPWIAPGTFCYPLKQKWFAGPTQMSNEPVYVDGVERPERKRIYYHYDLDFGGAEDLVDVLAVSDAMVQMVNRQRGSLILRDRRGWRWGYGHLASIEPTVKPNTVVRMGQKIGTLGKAGGSGGWTHLHFGLTRKIPDGRMRHVDSYVFAWQACLTEQKPKVIAVARPHHLVWTGEEVVLDASRSWAADGKELKYHWTFSDGSHAEGPTQKRKYAQAGQYSEILKVTDASGHVAYDFAIVQVIGRGQKPLVPPGIHAAYYPTMHITPKQTITFKGRTFRTTHGQEEWDFGDGTPLVQTKSDGNVRPHAKDGYAVTTHSFERAGDYIVTVHRTDEHGMTGTTRLWVHVDK